MLLRACLEEQPPNQKPPALGPGAHQGFGVLPLIYLDGRVSLPRRETEDSNPGPPWLKDAAGVEPAVSLSFF